MKSTQAKNNVACTKTSSFVAKAPKCRKHPQTLQPLRFACAAFPTGTTIATMGTHYVPPHSPATVGKPNITQPTHFPVNKLPLP